MIFPILKSDLVVQVGDKLRLGPVPLTDGRYFLSADVLVEAKLFADCMVGVEYGEATLADVQHLLPMPEEAP